MAKRRMGTIVVHGMTFLDIDWANKSAEGAICANCGYDQMFADGGLEWSAVDARTSR